MQLCAAALWALSLAGPVPAPGLPAPTAALAALEQAVRAGDGDALASLALPGRRVLVELAAPFAVRGAFAPGQLAAVFERLFTGLATTGVTLEVSPREPAAPIVFARGRWSWRRDGLESAVTLVVTLEWRNSAWRLVELRSAP